MPAKKSPKTPPSGLSPVSLALHKLREKDQSVDIGSLSDLHREVRSFSTGNLALDSITGVGGFPRGRVIELYGPNQSGKSTSALQAAAVHQRRVQEGLDTGAILYADYEHALDEDYCRSLGLDVNDSETFIVLFPESLEQGANIFRDLMREGVLAMAIFDSVAAMVSIKELEAETGAITVGDRARALHQFMRQAKGPIHRFDVSMIFLNHVMDVIETTPMGRQLASRGVARKTTPGGKALAFYADMRIEFSQVGTVKGSVHNTVTNDSEERVVATTVQAKTVKNKLSAPQRTASMRVHYGRGFSQTYSLAQVLRAYGIVKQAGPWYTISAEYSPTGAEWKFQGENKLLERLESDQQWFQIMMALAQSLMSSDSSPDDFDVDPSLDPETGFSNEGIDPVTGEIQMGAVQ